MEDGSVFKAISEYAWLIFIAVATVNLLFADLFGKTEESGNVDPEARRKYRLWFWGFSIFPWLVVGYAQLTGNVRYIWSYFRPQDGNPYVWAFYTAILAVYLASAYWVFFRNGAQIASDMRLVTFRVMARERTMSPFWIKVFAIAAFPFFAFWLWLASRITAEMPL